MTSRSESIDNLFEEYYLLKEQKADIDDQLSDLKKDIEDLFQEFDSDIIKSYKYTAKMNNTTSTRILKKDLPKHIIEEYSTPTTTRTLQVYKTSDNKPVRRSRSRSRSKSRETRIPVKKYIKNKYI